MYCILIRNSRFTRGTQEDSHEALRCIFNALKEEEIQVRYLVLKNHVATYIRSPEQQCA